METLKSFDIQMVDIDSINKRYTQIRKLVDTHFVEDIHYGAPFGNNSKFVLLKAGGEMLKVAFQLSDECIVEEEKLANGHVTYTVKTRLHYIPTKQYVGFGIGNCSTMEARYRYRNVNEATEVGVSSDFWDIKNDDSYTNEELRSMEMQEQIEKDLLSNGSEYDENARYWITKNDNGQWVYSIKLKAENPDIADTYNTVLKMAKKRSELDAIINVTGCSHMFTQDVEEFPEYQREQERSTKKRKAVGINDEQRSVIRELQKYLQTEEQRSAIDNVLEARISQDKADAVIQWLSAYKSLHETHMQFIDAVDEEQMDDHMSDTSGSAMQMLSAPVSDYTATALSDMAQELRFLQSD